MVEKVGLVLALCRPGVGICVHILLSRVIDFNHLEKILKLKTMAHRPEETATYHRPSTRHCKIKKLWHLPRVDGAGHHNH